MDNKTECIQAATVLNRNKYRNAEYDDKLVDNLVKYFETESYKELERFLKIVISHHSIKELDNIRSHLYDEIQFLLWSKIIIQSIQKTILIC